MQKLVREEKNLLVFNRRHLVYMFYKDYYMKEKTEEVTKITLVD